ncbi:hypothetical protein [Chondromyces apiculatus]|uniref:Uncharacterized protein n=1 Tax=Chondromyces apiculatus DSM 436 TaxID=1192034 RepID=A0A017SZV5_9BACT|nr:hypothetical protein [Chondromyces apiculatus]EYF02297.1 Hypothetical protein CAP_7226 [Chondromyces apiculatus DSM 436]
MAPAIAHAAPSPASTPSPTQRRTTPSPASAARAPAVSVASAAPAPAAPAAPAPAPPPVEVRVALSAAASGTLSEARLRRLIDIELGDTAQIAAAAGPLDVSAARVWIDRPTEARLEIQVRLDTRPVVRRGISISGLTADVAARLVAIATSEMVRAEIRRLRLPRRAPAPRRPTPEEVELASRDLDALDLAAGPDAAFLPASAAFLAGPAISLGLRRHRVDQTLFARWLASPLGDGTLRWLEAGLAADYRIWVHPSVRLSFGASAALASVRITGARAVDALPGEKDTWSARAGALAAIDTRIGGPLWLGLHLEPGAVLRAAPYQDAAGASQEIAGAWLGFGLSLTAEALSAAP